MVAATEPARTEVRVEHLDVRYGTHRALTKVALEVRPGEIFAIIGPAGSGKTTLLRVLSRMDVFDRSMRFDGRLELFGKPIESWRNLYALRRQIGVVQPLPVGLPLTVYDNVALAPRLRGLRRQAELDAIVEQCLRRAALWDEVKDRLGALGSLLSGGQQQRLAIARALSQGPRLLVLDEFSIAIDPVTTMRVEDMLRELKAQLTIILVTNLVQQARRLADRTAFFLAGRCLEVAPTAQLFGGGARDERTRAYLEGRIG